LRMNSLRERAGNFFARAGNFFGAQGMSREFRAKSNPLARRIRWSQNAYHWRIKK